LAGRLNPLDRAVGRKDADVERIGAIAGARLLDGPFERFAIVRVNAPFHEILVELDRPGFEPVDCPEFVRPRDLIRRQVFFPTAEVRYLLREGKRLFALAYSRKRILAFGDVAAYDEEAGRLAVDIADEPAYRVDPPVLAVLAQTPKE